jgi:hypothetical protein
MNNLKDCTRTRLVAVVNPGYRFLDDPDLEHHYRILALKEEAVARRENACYAKDRAAGSRGNALFHADEAIRLHKLADEQHRMHRPTPKVAEPPAHTRFETIVILLIALATSATMIACAVALAGLIIRWIGGLL